MSNMRQAKAIASHTSKAPAAPGDVRGSSFNDRGNPRLRSAKNPRGEVGMMVASVFNKEAIL